MLKAKLNTAETPSFGRKRCGTVASRQTIDGFSALSEKEMHIIFDSTAGTPYSDPGLCQTANWMIEHHKKLIERLRRKGIPKWYKAK